MQTSPEPKTNKGVAAQEQSNMDREDGVSQRQQASEYVAEIDREFMDEFRALLKHYIEVLSTDVSEISLGLNLSRPVVTDFLSGKRNDLPLSVGSIHHLHKILTDTERVQVKRRKKDSSETEAQTQSIKKIRAQAQNEREKLKMNGPDELLITAGFQPYKMKMVPVSPLQYPQLSFISYIYKDRPLSQDLFFQITEQELARKELEQDVSIRHKKNKIENDTQKQDISQRSKIKNDAQEEDIPLQEVKQLSWMNSKIKKEIERKYYSAIAAIKKKLTPHEKFGLLTSVLHNQLNKNEEISFKLKVIKVERIPLPLTLKNNETKESNTLLERIGKISCKYENLLLGFVSADESNIKSDSIEPSKYYPNHQLTRTVITCRYGEDREDVNFEYISAGTHLRTSISAILLNMGLYGFMPNIKLDVKCFEEDIATLVKVLIILRNDDLGESFLGEWVSSDLLQAVLQATIIASKKWLKHEFKANKELTNLYQDSVRKIAKLRSSFYEYRVAFDEYDFNDGIVNVDEFVLIGSECSTFIKKIEGIDIKTETKGIQLWNSLNANFYRLNIGSQLYRLTHENIKFNHNLSRKLLDEIDSELDRIHENISNISKTLIPSKISLEAEKIGYNISFGIPSKYSELQEESCGKTMNLLAEDNVLDYLTKMDEKIEVYLRSYVDDNKPYNDPGYDIHYSLGSYYSITGRLLLYRGTNERDLDSACDRLLRAIYFFDIIGLTRKVERNLTLFGRVKVRTKREDYLSQCIELSKRILDGHLSQVNAPKNENFELSIKSRRNSLGGEYNLIIKQNYEDSLRCCLEALKGSLWLGLNRHIADNLYTISRCARNLGNREIKADLKQHFPAFEVGDKLGERMYTEFIHTPETNRIAKEIVSMLFELYKKAKRSTCWSDVETDFRDASINIWNSWYRAATGDKKNEHPFAIDIRKGVFLGVVQSKYD